MSETQKEPRPERFPTNKRTIVVLVILVIGILVLLLRRNGDDRRAPAPTPIFEDVEQIAP